MNTYNGYKNWTRWNVSLWINNDEGLYNMALDYVRTSKTRKRAANRMFNELASMGITKTPDKASYSRVAIYDAMVDME